MTLRCNTEPWKNHSMLMQRFQIGITYGWKGAVYINNSFHSSEVFFSYHLNLEPSPIHGWRILQERKNKMLEVQDEADLDYKYKHRSKKPSANSVWQVEEKVTRIVTLDQG